MLIYQNENEQRVTLVLALGEINFIFRRGSWLSPAFSCSLLPMRLESRVAKVECIISKPQLSSKHIRRQSNESPCTCSNCHL